MPLIVLCGFPSSGKSRRTSEIEDYFNEKKNIKTTIVSDHKIDGDKNSVYSDSLKEKELRSSLKSEVQRHISKEDVVIFDSLNYIKGYRYELYCVTKSAQTPHCVIHCASNEDRAAEFNRSRPLNEQYNEEVFQGLVMRFEMPDSRNRWDSPLFTITPDDPLLFEEIYEALFLRKPPPPNLSTLPQPLSATNFLHELDTITMSVVHNIIEAQKTSIPGDFLMIPGAKDKIEFLRIIPLAELQRLRRQFITYTKSHAIDDTSKLANMFVQFLNNRTH